MQVKVHTHKCIGAGACVHAAPKVFDQDDQGIVIVLQKQPNADLHASVHEAIEACPAAVIQFEAGDE